MKRLNASVMTVAVVLALIAFIAPSSAYSITNSVVSYDPGTDSTTWTFNVMQGDDKWNVSHFVVAWCNVAAIDQINIPGSWSREYGTFTYADFTITGIKVEFKEDPPTTVVVEIILNGHFETNNNVNYIIKADNLPITIDTVFGPVACNCSEIPEFSTIAIPIASILGLLFFFNQRKRREE